MTSNRQDIAVGAIFVILGLLFAAGIFLPDPSLPIGTPRQMGPGFLPLGLSVILIVLGVAIAVKGWLASVPREERRPIPWRAIAIILPLPVFFGLTVNGLGLVVPVFVVAFVATFAAPKPNVLNSLAIAAGITVFCVVVFYYLADTPLRLVGPWLEFTGIVA